MLTNKKGDKDPKTHLVQVTFIFQGNVDKVGSLRNQFNAFEEWPNLPLMIIDAELHPFWRI